MGKNKTNLQKEEEQINKQTNLQTNQQINQQKEEKEQEEQINKQKEEQEEKKKMEELNHSLVRNISRILKPYFHALLGNYYKLVHCLIMLSSGIILLFNNNIFHLAILFNIICLDCIACVVLHDCPITLLEQKYLNHNLIAERSKILQEANVFYKCDHHYEKTLEFLTNMVCFLFGKILFLISMKMFDIKFISSS